MISGAGAGLCQIIVTTPMELLKITMQMQVQPAAVVGAATETGIFIIKSIFSRI